MTLYLLPNLLCEESNPFEQFVPALQDIVMSLDYLIAESEKGGRKFAKRFGKMLSIKLLNEHTTPAELDDLLDLLKEGKRLGVISDAGIPCIADPGSQLVAEAHKYAIPVHVISGPCSIILALMLSGLSGQHFSFRGYLHRESGSRKQEIKEYENISKREHATQIFIEAPYRNDAVFQELIQVLHSNTRLCVASNLTKEQFVQTHRIQEWKKMSIPPISKRPTVFLFLAQSNFSL